MAVIRLLSGGVRGGGRRSEQDLKTYIVVTRSEEKRGSAILLKFGRKKKSHSQNQPLGASEELRLHNSHQKW